MPTRLTDERLGEVEQTARDGYAVRYSCDDVLAMATELRERRAADLNDEDRDALAIARGYLNRVTMSEAFSYIGDDHAAKVFSAMRILDRLVKP